MKRAVEICPTTTLGRAKSAVLLVDVRRKDEVETVAFDVPNCINIPLDELAERLPEIPKDKEVIMVCRSGGRSLKATYYLMNAGYEHVSNMRDGIIKWAAKGFPTKGDAQSLIATASCDCSQPDCC
ncbi:MAG TPA: rhodanese-like domain-containing protein [Bacteroidetes bacterium]|nr:rhodanese-like domain-containing protein [Bacteroidota bacterium]